MAAVPERVLAYVDTVADEVAAVVGVDLTGVYTTGSLALGDFHPGRSDIDLIAVVARPVAPTLLDEVVGRLDDERLACPAAGLEFVLYPTATVARPTLEAGYLLNLNTGRDLPRVVSDDPTDGPGFWYPIDRAITRQSGRAVRGQPPEQVFAQMPAEFLVPAVVAAVEAYSRPGPADLLDNAVLNGCRALCFAREEHWYPKLAAAQRAMDVDEPFSELIRAAVASYETGRRQPGQLSVDAAVEFLARVLDHLRGLAGVVTPRA